MDPLWKQSPLSTRFAVNRDYQPARIERELLAHVFDLVEQSGRKIFTPGDDRLESAIITFSAGSKDPRASSSGIAHKSSEIIELEEVA